MSLCADRSGFLRHGQIVLIPIHIRSHIVHPGDNAQIEGFRKLFDYLNTDPAADDVRQLVVNYFNDYPYLQQHLHERLSKSSFHPSYIEHIT